MADTIREKGRCAQIQLEPERRKRYPNTAIFMSLKEWKLLISENLCLHIMVSQVKAKGVLGEETSNNDWIFFFFVKKLMANISIIHEEAIDFFGWKDWLLSTCPLQRKSSLTQRCGGQGVRARVHMDALPPCTCLCTHCLCAYFYLTFRHFTQIR